MADRKDNTDESKFLNELYKQTSGMVNKYVHLSNISKALNLDTQRVTELAESLDVEGLVKLSPKVSGSDMRLVKLNPKGKDTINNKLEKNMSSNNKTTLINYGTMSIFLVNQGNDLNINQSNQSLDLQNLINFVNAVKSEYDSYLMDIKNRIVENINNFDIEFNSSKGIDKFKEYGRKIWNEIGPVCKPVIKDLVELHLKHIFGICPNKVWNPGYRTDISTKPSEPASILTVNMGSAFIRLCLMKI